MMSTAHYLWERIDRISQIIIAFVSIMLIMTSNAICGLIGILGVIGAWHVSNLLDAKIAQLNPDEELVITLSLNDMMIVLMVIGVITLTVLMRLH